MAKIKICNGKDKYRDENTKDNVINYILNEQKTPHNCVGGSGVDMNCPAESMQQVCKKFNKLDGVQLRHSVMMFSEKEIDDVAEANEIGMMIAQGLGRRHQTVYAVHENKDNLHIHFVSNSVSHIDGKKYHGNRQEFYQDMNMMRKILRNHNIPKLIYVK